MVTFDFAVPTLASLVRNGCLRYDIAMAMSTPIVWYVIVVWVYICVYCVFFFFSISNNKISQNEENSHAGLHRSYCLLLAAIQWENTG